jgi:OOP family OmpA-OmpF porin
MRLKLVIMACSLATQMLPCVVQAEERSSGFYVAPMVTAVHADEDRAVDDDAAFTFAAGWQASRKWNVELNLFRGRFDGAGGDDLDVDAAGLNALRVFRRDARVAPYLLFGLGAQRNDSRLGGSDTGPYADAGAGLLATLRKSPDGARALFLRLDARARYNDVEGSPLDYLFGVGLQYAFGKRASQSASAPVSAMSAPPPAPADSDRDGVPDDRDRCPGTPEGRAVGADGCELDSDGDGVVDSADACPGTAAGARVDVRGCELKEQVELPRVTFEYDSDRLRSEAFAVLDEAAETLRRNPDLRVEVAGHTDSRGPDAYNLSLSLRRAEAVRRYLIGKHVTNVLTVRGYGESEPVADNATEEGRARNRRVVLRILTR